MKKRNLFASFFFILTFMTFALSSPSVSYADMGEIDYGVEYLVSAEGIEFADLPVSAKKVKVQIDIYDVHIYDENDNELMEEDVMVTLEGYDDDNEELYFVPNGDSLSFTAEVDNMLGQLCFEIYTSVAHHFTLKLKVSKLGDVELTISCPKLITVAENGYKRIKPTIYYGKEKVLNEYSSIKVTSSNKKAARADGDMWEIDGKFEISGNGKPGKCTVKVVVKYKKVTCETSIKVTVKSALKSSLAASGGLNWYDTRDNIFKMTVKNNSKKAITIYSSGAVALDVDYRSFDRNLKMTGGRSKVVIKPRETKVIKWRVIGSVTWYNVKDFEIHAKWGYKGKKSWVSVDYEDIMVFRQGKWKAIS